MGTEEEVGEGDGGYVSVRFFFPPLVSGFGLGVLAAFFFFQEEGFWKGYWRYWLMIFGDGGVVGRLLIRDIWLLNVLLGCPGIKSPRENRV